MFDIMTVFDAPDLGYTNTRIPALVMTKRQTLVAFCEARRGAGGDWDAIDIVMRRSTDRGESWGEIKTVVASHGRATSNATPIIDDRGTLHLLHQRSYEQAYYLRSTDEGASWSEPREITDVFEAFRQEYPWRVLAPGPGHAIQLASGRLLVPIWLSDGGDAPPGAAKLAHRPSCVAVIYSDDYGDSWHRGDIVVEHSERVPNPSETVALELESGEVMLNIRSESPLNQRLISFSRDGVTNWSTPSFDPGLFEPICMASLIRYSRAPDVSRIIFCNPDSRADAQLTGHTWGARARQNLTVKLSYDDGRSWSKSRVLEPGIAGYSDLAVGQDGTIYCLYEHGGRDGNMFQNPYVSLARFSLDWLES